jgi:hypothetical protein
MYVVRKEKVRSIAWLVLDHNALNRKVCARSHVTTHKTHSVAMKAMAARAVRVSRVYVDVLDHRPCAQSWSIRSIAGALDRESVRSIAQIGTPCFFSTFYITLMVRTYNIRNH